MKTYDEHAQTSVQHESTILTTGTWQHQLDMINTTLVFQHPPV